MANLVTIFRTLLVLCIIPLLYLNTPISVMSAFLLTILIISLDGVDGYIARKLNETSKFGSVLDIIGDRIVENVYWLIFLAFDWINIFIPIIVIMRGIIVDGIRSIALEHGLTAFGSSTMMNSKLGQLLVSSNFSRASYAVCKGFAFSLMIAIHIPNWQDSLFKSIVMTITYTLIYLTIAFCIIRGLPVLAEGKRFLSK